MVAGLPAGGIFLSEFNEPGILCGDKTGV